MNDSNGTPTLTNQELLTSFLTERDAECPVCHYNVKGLPGQNCPECGSALELRLGSSDLHVMPWVAALLGSAVPAGFFLIVSIVTIILWLTQGAPTGTALIWMWIFYALALATTLACFVLIACRRRILRKDRKSQWNIAVLSIFLSVGSVIVYMTFFILAEF